MSAGSQPNLRGKCETSEKRTGTIEAAYVHIPFCSYKCDFCDFAAFAGLSHLEEDYFQALAAEIKQRTNSTESPVNLSSIYFGGGTPGLVPAERIEAVLAQLDRLVQCRPDIEINLETTPHAITDDKLSSWRRCGVNRLSIGIESLDQQELESIGRDHDREQALRGIEMACSAGFDVIGLDFMYGLPTQTLESWRRTLQEATELISEKPDIKHISAYGLHLARNSPLYSRFPRGSVEYPSDNVFADMLECLIETLVGAGFQHYEVSNFARPEAKCRHNLTYWSNRHYLGFGVGAHRYVDGWRSASYRSIARYIRNPLADEMSEFIDDETRLREAIMLGLRMRSGIDLAEFEKTYGIRLEDRYAGEIERLEKDGFICVDRGRLSITRKGLPVSNNVLVEFI